MDKNTLHYFSDEINKIAGFGPILEGVWGYMGIKDAKKKADEIRLGIKQVKPAPLKHFTQYSMQKGKYRLPIG